MNEALADAALLFGSLLPGAVVASAVAIRAMGLLGDPADRSGLFRALTRRMGSPASWVAIPAIGFWALGNLAPFLYLVNGPAGTPTAVFAAFFVVEAVWFFSVGLDIHRSRLRGGPR
jgi:hypothetical protein